MASAVLVLGKIWVKMIKQRGGRERTSRDFRLIIRGGLVSSFIRTTFDSSLPLFPNPVLAGRGEVRSNAPLARSAVITFLTSVRAICTLDPNKVAE